MADRESRQIAVTTRDFPPRRPLASPMGFRQATDIHIAEWVAEAAGTALLLLGGLSAVCLDFGPHSVIADRIPSVSLRLLITGLLFAGTGSLVAVSPLGKLSGAHLNPVVTLAFRITGRVHDHDLLGYVVAQVLGAIVGTVLLRVLWGDAAIAIGDGVTSPSPSTSAAAAVAIEALMTAVLVATILGFLSLRQLAAWTPVAVWIVVALLVWRGAPYTGTSLNPARSIGPALVARNLDELWIYVAGPAIGACAAAIAARWLRMQPLTGKLCHDTRYPSTHASDLPVSSGLRRRQTLLTMNAKQALERDRWPVVVINEGGPH
jgi:aquaporin Z